MSAPVHVLVFARSPIPGRAKTRLIPALGAEGAARLYLLLLEHALVTARAADFDAVEVWMDAEPIADEVRELARVIDARLAVQTGADLGARMDAAFGDALARGVLPLLMGSDVPSLTSLMLREAAAALRQGRDVVIAPALDGGYGLIGVGRRLPALFEAMPWGGPEVLAETRRRIDALGCSSAELTPVWDVDEPADLARLDELPELRDWRRRIGFEAAP